MRVHCNNYDCIKNRSTDTPCSQPRFSVCQYALCILHESRRVAKLALGFIAHIFVLGYPPPPPPPPPHHVHSLYVISVPRSSLFFIILRPNFLLGLFQRALCLLGALTSSLGLPQNQHIYNSHLKSVWALRNKKHGQH